jgi:hypothetical protein
MADIRKLLHKLMEQCSCTNESANFESWMAKVRTEITRMSGMDADDLPDAPYADWYEDDISPSQAARKAIKNAEMGESVGQPEGGNPNAVAEELSRKYYVAIAQILRDSENKDQIAKGLVQLFKSDNPRFDTDRFMRAAGFGLEPVVADKASMAQQQVNKDVDRAARDLEYEKKWGKPR